MNQIKNKEQYFINQFAKSKFIGDDGAVIGKYVYSMDAFFEDVHFKTSWMSLKQIAQKAMLINISDAIVMNAKPKYALLSVAIPSYYGKKELDELASGFNKVAKQFGCEIIGGDTISNEKLDISITIISKTKKAMLRTGTKKGDLVCYTGELGSVKRDLEFLLNEKKVSKKSKFLQPKLHPDFFYEVAPNINSAMDISDGLFFELERLSKANKIGFEFFKNISNDIGCSGEEYEVLFTFDEKNLKKINKIAQKHNINLNIFARATNGSFGCKCQNHHFK